MGNKNTSSQTSDINAILRRLPSVHQLVEAVLDRDDNTDAPRLLVVEAAREALAEFRVSIAAQSEKDAETFTDKLIGQVMDRLEAQMRFPLAPVINATGIIIHTGLGRAPLAGYAARAAIDAARNYAPVELDLESGSRGKRSTIVRSLLRGLTGAESATVVNNNAAALMIVLSSIARQRGVIVSRGELIEIGGSFRLPDVMKAGGAILREVGTTNRTRLTDYENAIDETTGALMKVHTSNYCVTGFTQSVPIDELATLGRHHDLPVIDDIGSGALRDLSDYGIETDEPNASASIAAGADLVLFSGDKLLGGPQAGVIVGRADLIERIEKNPMMRAMRVDKIILAALGATLQLHRDPRKAAAEVPVLNMLTMKVDDLSRRAEAMAQRLGSIDGVAKVRLEQTAAYLGGGSLPTEEVPSIAVVIETGGMGVDELVGKLRTSRPAVVCRIRDGAAWFDLRTVFPDQDEVLIEAIKAAVSALSGK